MRVAIFCVQKEGEIDFLIQRSQPYYLKMQKYPSIDLQQRTLGALQDQSSLEIVCGKINYVGVKSVEVLGNTMVVPTKYQNRIHLSRIYQMLRTPNPHTINSNKEVGLQLITLTLCKSSISMQLKVSFVLPPCSEPRNRLSFLPLIYLKKSSGVLLANLTTVSSLLPRVSCKLR